MQVNGTKDTDYRRSRRMAGDRRMTGTNGRFRQHTPSCIETPCTLRSQKERGIRDKSKIRNHRRTHTPFLCHLDALTKDLDPGGFGDISTLTNKRGDGVFAQVRQLPLVTEVLLLELASSGGLTSRKKISQPPRLTMASGL